MIPQKNTQYGLWENGKRVRWFDENEKEEIQENKLDYKKFKESDTSPNFAPNASFEQPETFQERLDILKGKLNN